MPSPSLSDPWRDINEVMMASRFSFRSFTLTLMHYYHCNSAERKKDVERRKNIRICLLRVPCYRPLVQETRNKTEVKQNELQLMYSALGGKAIISIVAIWIADSSSLLLLVSCHCLVSLWTSSLTSCRRITPFTPPFPVHDLVLGYTHVPAAY